MGNHVTKMPHFYHIHVHVAANYNEHMVILRLNVALYGSAQDTLYLGAHMYLIFANALLMYP